MSVLKRLTVSAAAVVTLAGAGLLLAPAAEAAPNDPAKNCKAKDETGALGHKGKSITCSGTNLYFGAILCRKIDDHSNYTYWHYGPVVNRGSKSTVWCDYGAVVDAWGALEA
ncbi:hypothetical protein ACWEPM_11470 [Streptomyces sp. NPDC004244]